MGLISRVKEFVMSILSSRVEKEFNVKIITSPGMETAQREWKDIVQGYPYWANENVRTINFAGFLCRYTAKKACLDIKVNVSGSPRADYINKCIENMVSKAIRRKTEDACALGGIVLKPSGTYNPTGAIDYVLPGSFAVTEQNANGDILGMIFMDRITKGTDYYTRLEYHHFENLSQSPEGTRTDTERVYVIKNKAYRSNGIKSLGNEIPLSDVPEWSAIQPEIMLSNVEKPLFAYFKMPLNNTISNSSAEGISIFAGCMEELRNLDIAWSVKSNEVEDSTHMTFIDENRISRPDTRNRGKKQMINLPRFVKGLRSGVDDANTIHEHVATLLTTDRLADINSILSMISTKAGFSQGQFILDRKSGAVTATQIESDDRETVETIIDVRNALKAAIKDLIYAMDKYCDVFFGMPSGYVNALDTDIADEDIFYFRDLMSTFEQDRQRAYQLMIQGVYSRKKYLMEYEGFGEKEADEMLEQARHEAAAGNTNSLFGEE